MAISCLHGDKIRGAKIAARVRALAVVGAMLAALAAPALAEHTRWWRQETFEDFDKGTPKGVALRSDGKLFLAPRFAEFADVNLAYLLALRADGKGNLYAAGGSNAKVLRLDAAGKATSVFESQELAAQALAIDSSGNLFVGTSPDGKVYKVTPGGQSSVFFDPKTKYIWDLAVDKDGTVYVATGDTGKIFVVAPDGKGQVFYSSGETHIRSLASSWPATRRPSPWTRCWGAPGTGPGRRRRPGRCLASSASTGWRPRTSRGWPGCGRCWQSCIRMDR